MLNVYVGKPIKTDHRYEFLCRTEGSRANWRQLLKRGKFVLRGYGSLRNLMQFKALSFGYVSRGYGIRHSELWDSIYPMMFLAHKLYGEAVVHFDYPILRKVRDFYIQQAQNVGLRLSIEGETFDCTYELPTRGHILAFGGGKDSRMLLGALREIGRDPLLVTSGTRNAPDLPNALVTLPLNGAIIDRIMPGIMMLGENFYFGSSLAEASLNRPWHQYYAWGAPRALADFSQLLQSLGVNMNAHAPATVLPSNLIQKILHDRYHELYTHQYSVKRNQMIRKNLRVSLGKLQHGISYEEHCSPSIFKALLETFVQQQISNPNDFGRHNEREMGDREMRGIIYRHRHLPQFETVRDLIPGDWQADWIDAIHPYVCDTLDPALLEIFRQYGQELQFADSPIAHRYGRDALILS